VNRNFLDINIGLFSIKNSFHYNSNALTPFNMKPSYYLVLLVVGDSGYPLEPWLLTPVSAPTSHGQESYNAAHTKTRSVVERSFGLLKSRFRCLDKSGGTLLYKPDKTCRIVVACFVLHNYCTRHNIATPPQVVDALMDDTVNMNITENGGAIGSAIDLRRNLIANVFS